MDKAIRNKKKKYSHLDLSKHTKEGWNKYKKLKGKQAVARRTQAGLAKATAATKGSCWFHQTDGRQLRTSPNDTRISSEGWLKGRFRGTEICRKAALAGAEKKRNEVQVKEKV
jgi:hypothetical protein